MVAVKHFISRFAFIGVVLFFCEPMVAKATPPTEAEVSSIRNFILKLYLNYPRKVHSQTFDPFGRSASAIFSPSTVALLKENDNLTPRGEMGALDGDPICQCQDSGDLDIHILSILYRVNGEIIATVDIEPGHRMAYFSLEKSRGNWKIYDVWGSAISSMRTSLIKDNHDKRVKRNRK